MEFDCNSQKYCPTCKSGIPSAPCTGVIGGVGPDSSQSLAGPYGTQEDIMSKLRDKDTTNTCGSQSSLGSYDVSGTCIKCDTSPCPNAPSAMNTQGLIVNDTVINPNQDMATFPLQAMHKVWGDAGGKWNRGVNKENVYISQNKESVTCVDSGFNTSAYVVNMEAHGDQYKGPVKGLTLSKPESRLKERAQGDAPVCPQLYETDDGTRVGGIAVTRQNFGPGVYNMLVKIPKTSDTSTKGRGYVFAMWTFHYEEIYYGAGGENRNDNSQARGDLSQLAVNPIFPCYNQMDITPETRKERKIPDLLPCAIKKYAQDSDMFSAITHEIDIEIPTNGNGLSWKDDMTWDTVNWNTWNNDINDYELKTGAYYTQVTDKLPEDPTDGKYHWFTIDWYVDNTDFKNNYVAFYYDDPFDPKGVAGYNGKKFNKQPQGKPKHATRRFVPTRAGRLNIGPWFGWWGYGGDSGKPNFDTIVAKLAHVSITPYNNSGFDFPQTYDQIFDNGTVVRCDFQDMQGGGGGGGGSKTKLPWWVILLIVLGCVIVVITVVLVSWKIHKSKLN